MTISVRGPTRRKASPPSTDAPGHGSVKAEAEALARCLRIVLPVRPEVEAEVKAGSKLGAARHLLDTFVPVPGPHSSSAAPARPSRMQACVPAGAWSLRTCRPRTPAGVLGLAVGVQHAHGTAIARPSTWKCSCRRSSLSCWRRSSLIARGPIGPSLPQSPSSVDGTGRRRPDSPRGTPVA